MRNDEVGAECQAARAAWHPAGRAGRVDGRVLRLIGVRRETGWKVGTLVTVLR